MAVPNLTASGLPQLLELYQLREMCDGGLLRVVGGRGAVRAARAG